MLNTIRALHIDKSVYLYQMFENGVIHKHIKTPPIQKAELCTTVYLVEFVILLFLHVYIMFT